MKFFEIVTLVFILLGCSSTEVQRYKDIYNPSQSKVAVIFKYQVLPKEKVAKENFEKVLAAKGFEVVEFEPFDSTLDYLIVAITENNYRNDYIKATFVDYKKREIVGSFTYTPFSSLNIKKTTKLLEKMLDAPIKHPDIETSLENGESKGFLSRDDDVRNLIDEREYAPKRLAVLKKVWEGSAMYSIRLIKNDGKWQIVEKNRELIL